MLYKSTDLHPLAKYIRNWEAFNAIDRKLLRAFMLKALGTTLLLMILISYAAA